MVLAVNVSGHDANGAAFEKLTHTLDLSAGGFRLGGMESLVLRPGDIVEIKRANRKAKFRVAWVGDAESNRFGHVGLKAIDAPANFWGLEVPSDGEAPTPIPEFPPALRPAQR
jgi:hypothetical protein